MSEESLRPDEAQLLIDAPRQLFSTAADMYSVPYEQVREWQLVALRRRFEKAVDAVPLARRLADRAGLTSITSLVDGSRLLYPANIYKSYQTAWLESGAFDRMTDWLQQLTAHDLSSVNTAACSSLDQWFTTLEDASPLRLCHSSSTSGKLSFVPRAEAEWSRRATTMPYASEAAGVEEGPRAVSFAGLPIVSPFYRSGHSAFLMSLDWNIRVHGDESLVETLYPGHLSSDLLGLAARLRLAAGSGALPSDASGWALPSWLADRWDEVLELTSRPASGRLREFVQHTYDRFAGQRVFLIGVWPSLVDAAAVAADLGIRDVFAPDSIIHTGGGGRGRDLPADAAELVNRWLGVPAIRDTYGMSEIMGMNVRCVADRYHLNPWTVPYVLDDDGRTPMPAEGRQTGLFGAIDLLAESYWGGYASTDRVTLTWNPACPCGRTGPYLDTDIRRATAGADDKVSCAATPALHDDLGALLRQIGGMS